MTDIERHLLAHLQDGRWRIIDTLKDTLGCSRRAVEDAIENLRLEGHPIVGGATGVRLSDDHREVRAYAEDRRRRLVSISKGTRALLTTARKMEGVRQGSLWGDEPSDEPMLREGLPEFNGAWR